MKVVGLCFFVFLTFTKGDDPLIHMNASELIRHRGFPCEDHSVTTKDGYILGLQRIPYGKKNTTRPRPVAFLQHGLLCSSTNWVTNPEYEALGFILAEAGFDVWLGNIRGNTYSRKHVHLKPDQKEFWNFTFDQHALLDLPAMIDYVLNVSGHKDLFYVGHSQGTVMGFAGFSSMPELASKVKVFAALAPVATVKYIEGAFKIFTEFYKILAYILDHVGDGEFLPQDFFLNYLAAELCRTDVKIVCGDVLFLICGWDTGNLNDSRIPIYVGHTPAGTSVKNCVHYAQEVRSGNFSMFDYGSVDENRKHYGQTYPPQYDVSKMKVPVGLFHGTNDWLADPEDFDNLVPKLSNIIFNKQLDGYNHLDFIWGVDAYKDIYADIIQLFWAFNN